MCHPRPQSQLLPQRCHRQQGYAHRAGYRDWICRSALAGYSSSYPSHLQLSLGCWEGSAQEDFHCLLHCQPSTRCQGQRSCGCGERSSNLPALRRPSRSQPAYGSARLLSGDCGGSQSAEAAASAGCCPPLARQSCASPFRAVKVPSHRAEASPGELLVDCGQAKRRTSISASGIIPINGACIPFEQCFLGLREGLLRFLGTHHLPARLRDQLHRHLLRVRHVRAGNGVHHLLFQHRGVLRHRAFSHKGATISTTSSYN
jgi:hypothetical protein